MDVNVKKLIILAIILSSLLAFGVYFMKLSVVDSKEVLVKKWDREGLIYVNLEKDGNKCKVTTNRGYNIFWLSCSVWVGDNYLGDYNIYDPLTCTGSKTYYCDKEPDKCAEGDVYFCTDGDYIEFNCDSNSEVTVSCSVFMYNPNIKDYDYATGVTLSYKPKKNCKDECTAGDTRYICLKDNQIYRQTCGDYDGDGCTEWGGDTFIESCGDSWYVCDGNAIYKHETYCYTGEILSNPSCHVSEEYVKNCDSYDGWYDAGSYEEFRDYYCVADANNPKCEYKVTKTREKKKVDLIDWIINIFTS